MLYQNVDVKIPGLDLSSAFSTADKEQLMQILELILEDEIRMCRFLLSETSTTLRFEKDFIRSFETNKGPPEGDAVCVSFNVAFENAVRVLHGEIKTTLILSTATVK